MAMTSMQVKMSKRTATATAAEVPATATVLRGVPLLGMEVVVLLSWGGLMRVVEIVAIGGVEEEVDGMERVSKQIWIAVRVSIGGEGVRGQEEVPAGCT